MLDITGMLFLFSTLSRESSNFQNFVCFQFFKLFSQTLPLSQVLQPYFGYIMNEFRGDLQFVEVLIMITLLRALLASCKTESTIAKSIEKRKI